MSDDVQVLQKLVLVLMSRVEALEKENAELRGLLNKNSKNSHQPPSADGLSKKPAFPKVSGKKRGGQVGHKGKTLLKVEVADHTLVHIADSCPCCTKKFTVSDVSLVGQTRQVFDFPQPKIEVTEHQIGHIVCCGQVHKGTFPTTVSQPAQYGAKIKAMSVLLNTDYKMPFEKISCLFSDLFGCSFNVSTALSANKSCFEALAPVEQFIKEKVCQSPVVHFDETGMRVEGKLQWFHTASTPLYTYLFAHEKRGKIALQSEQSLIKDFKNWAVHDCWASYFNFTECQHALCNAHILRELVALQETGSQWAGKMHELLMQLYHLSEKATLILPQRDAWLGKYQLICHEANKQEPQPTKSKRGKPKNSKGRNLLHRLVEHQDAVLAFAFVELIPFTNNQAERDIRCLKTKQKVANSFRTSDGANHFARIQGFVSSLRKQAFNVFQQLITLFHNNTSCLHRG